MSFINTSHYKNFLKAGLILKAVAFCDISAAAVSRLMKAVFMLETVVLPSVNTSQKHLTKSIHMLWLVVVSVSWRKDFGKHSPQHKKT